MSFSELINEIVNRVNMSGCRVTIPYSEPSPIRASFDSSFGNAEYIHLYPPTLHIYGMPGSVAVSDLQRIDKIGPDDYLVHYGRDGQASDILVKITA